MRARAAALACLDPPLDVLEETVSPPLGLATRPKVSPLFGFAILLIAVLLLTVFMVLLLL
jgi:hypothetical protein